MKRRMVIAPMQTCPECARLEARIADLRQLYGSANGYHLKAVQLQNAEAARRYEEAMNSYSEAIKNAHRRLAKHQLKCESTTA